MGVSIFGHKGRYSKATMRKWTKTELIDYITICEHNERVAYETMEQQAKNFQTMLDNIKNYKDPIDGICGGKQ